ncbi:MAG: glycosyltransferase family 39 protein [Chloroflexi bacterium]|nr:glycosyltransferase family 39 protein [Chloroflexota bacterium]MCC6896117.1 glycosyltransferase family 39 protein [Anaerolineae bacterium]
MVTDSAVTASTNAFTQNLSKWRSLIAVALVIMVCIPALFFNLERYPRLWFDEGYKLNAAYTLVQDGQYASYTVDGYVPFDPGTSGGPADILPAALAIKLFGTSVTVARLASVLYTLLAAVALYYMGCSIWDEKTALFCVLLVIATGPIENVSLVVMGRQSLSEATAFSLMVCGLWILTKGWGKRSLQWSILSGLVMGLGMLSKTQIAISLVPSLLTVAAWRWWQEKRQGFGYLFAPALGIIAVFLGWTLIGQLFTTPEIRQQNSTLLLDAIRTNIFTDLFGSNLDNQSLFVIAIMLFGVFTNVVRIFKTPPLKDKHWVELVLIGFCLYTSIWFTVLSVGWPRYAFSGLMIGLLLSGRSVWAFITRSDAPKWWVSAGFGFLVFAGIAVNVVNSVAYAADSDVQEAAAYIANHIPQDAVIETWEWELDMLSHHRQYHHPPQALLFEAIRQNARHRFFDLSYDPLAANPDYLIVGTFGRWTGIYDEAMLAENFTSIAQFGVYEVFQRLK